MWQCHYQTSLASRIYLNFERMFSKKFLSILLQDIFFTIQAHVPSLCNFIGALSARAIFAKVRFLYTRFILMKWSGQCAKSPTGEMKKPRGPSESLAPAPLLTPPVCVFCVLYARVRRAVSLSRSHRRDACHGASEDIVVARTNARMALSCSRWSLVAGSGTLILILTPRKARLATYAAGNADDCIPRFRISRK